jgi:glycerol-3-phosphate acyltransferase PlsY
VGGLVAMVWTISVMVLAYLLGSLSFAVIVSKVMRLNDPRSYGSGNPGATNVLRSGNKLAALFTLLLDALKGAVAVLLVRALTHQFDFGAGVDAAALAGLAAFLGHLYPAFFRFQGGKGVATAAGVLLALNPWVGLLSLATWLAIALLTRYSSLAALVTALMAPVYTMLIQGAVPSVLIVAIMSALLIWRHRANVSKLMKGTESKLGSKAKSP